MKKIILTIFIIRIGIIGFSQIPQENLILWLLADSIELNGSSVSKLFDIGPNHYNFEQNTVNSQPLIIISETIEKPFLRFDGSNDFFQYTFQYPIIGATTIFTIWKTNQTGQHIFISSQDVGMIDQNSGGNVRVSMTPSNIQYTKNSPFPFPIQSSCVFNTSNSKVFENGVLKVSGSLGEVNISTFSIGKWLPNSGRWFNGDFAELLIYNTVFPDSTRQQIENYLMDKYAPPVELGDSIFVDNFCDYTITSADKSYYKSYVWSDDSFDNSLIINREGNYSVTVTDIFDRISTDTVYVSFKKVNILSDTVVCAGNSIVWDTELNNSDYSFQWIGSNETFPAITISEENQYAVIITDINNCKYYSDTIDFHVDNYEFNTSIGGEDTAMCINNRLMLLSNIEETASYLWSTGETTPEISIFTSGDYFVTVTNSRGCVAIDTISVNIVGEAPIPDFDFTGVCDGENFTFTDVSTGDSPILSWQWKINDSVVSDQQNFDIIFNSAGIFNVELSVTSIGCSNFIQKNIPVRYIPEINFSQNNYCQNVNIGFSSLSNVQNSSITTNVWNINDNVLLGDTVEYFFENDGVYPIQLTSISDFGCIRSSTKNIIIKNASKPEFDIYYFCIDEPTFFVNRTNTNLINPIEFCKWTINNSDTSYYFNTSYIFDSVGENFINLFIRYFNGCEVAFTKSIEIFDRPTVEVLDSAICLGTIFSPEILDNPNNGEIISYNWNFYDDTLIYEIHEKNPNFLADKLTDYYYTLEIISDKNCWNIISDTLFVLENPTANFDFDIFPEESFYTAHFLNNSENVESFLWNFGDNQTSTSKNPIHTYSDEGNKNVQLTVISENTCENSTNKIITIVKPNIDLLLYDLKNNIENSFLEITLFFINNSNVELNNIDVIVNVENVGIFNEKINKLSVDEILPYTLKTKMMISESNLPKYICVDAFCNLSKIYGEKNLDNNSICLYNNEDFVITSPFPNPAKNELNFKIVSSTSDNFQVNIFDAQGKTIYSKKENFSQGINIYTINTINFLNGFYYLQIIRNSKSEKFVFEIVR
ncbi:MAG: PKD domain-containing protein [Bacteroidales bacterium]|jgi:PKD repeat protein|nr:PKD domain-containing protein [Bacteroidales bacterium]